MATNENRLTKAQRELDRRAPADPLIVRFVWIDPWPDGAVVAEQVVDFSGPVIQLTWGDESENATRYDAPGRA